MTALGKADRALIEQFFQERLALLVGLAVIAVTVRRLLRLASLGRLLLLLLLLGGWSGRLLRRL